MPVSEINTFFNVIRNCSHFSYVHTGFDLDEKGVPHSVIRKTFEQSGVKSLQREVESISWYAKKVGKSLEEVILDFDHSDAYGILKLKFHAGEVGNYHLSIMDNYTKIVNLIEHYKSVFSEPGKICAHGDLSLGNVIFENDAVQWIIDWENANSVMPWEYDLIYCITENCLFRFMKRNRLSKQEILVYRELLNKFNNTHSINNLLNDGPAKWCRNTALTYIKKTGVQHQKCPFIAIDEKIINKLDGFLNCPKV